jgi:hypothetical protein
MRALRPLPILAPSLAALLAGPAAAAAVPSPPPGWEAPPPLAAPGARKPGMPAGCAADALCRVRQLVDDGTPPDRVERVVEVRFADLPALVVREAPAGGPPVTGTPGLTILAGGDARAPWLVVPWGNVWIHPDGAVGEITWDGGSDDWLSHEMPFSRGPGVGFGALHTIPKGTKDVRSILAGRIDYTSIDEGPGGALAVDYVTGELVGTPELAVSRWGHADAAPVVGRYLHAFRGRAPSDEARPGEAVTFVLPSVSVDFEAKDVKLAGGNKRIGHAVRGSNYTSVTLPAGPGGSGIATFHLRADDLAGCFAEPAGAEKPPPSMRIAISSSQTSAEGSARVRVTFFVRDPSAPDPRD